MNGSTLACVLVTCAALSGQQASYTYIDQVAPYQNQSPLTMTALSRPVLGSTLRVEVRHDGWMFGHLLTGLRDPAFDLGPLCPGGCFGVVHASPDVVLPIVQSPQVVEIPIPNVPALAGLTFYQQVFLQSHFPLWPMGPVLSLYAVDRAGRAVIGH
jgi:hypothetical protein